MEQPAPTHLARMGQNAHIRAQAFADMPGLPDLIGSVNGHVNEQRCANNIAARDETPVTTVIGIIAIITHREIAIGWNDELAVFNIFVHVRRPLRAHSSEEIVFAGREILDRACGVSGIAPGVRLIQPLPVYVNDSLTDPNGVTRNANDALN